MDLRAIKCGQKDDMTRKISKSAEHSILWLSASINCDHRSPLIAEEVACLKIRFCGASWIDAPQVCIQWCFSYYLC